MDEMMKLVIGWTIVLAFIFTTAMTCMSLVGWIKFASRKQQQGLYAALILELVVGTASKVTNNASFSPSTSSEIIRSEGAEEVVAAEVDAAVNAPAGSATAVDKQTLERLVNRLRVVPGSQVAKRRDELMGVVKDLPAGKLQPADVQKLRATRALTMRVP